jgi:hypothetical protein
MKIVMWLILIFLTTSCAPLTTTYPSSEIIIGVRDSSTHEPISGATVLSSVNVFFYPVMDDNMFGRGGVIPSFVAINEPDGWTAITDHDGQAFASTAGGSPSVPHDTRFVQHIPHRQSGRCDDVDQGHSRSGNSARTNSGVSDTAPTALTGSGHGSVRFLPWGEDLKEFRERIIELINHPLFEWNDGVVRDRNMLGTHLRTALCNVAVANPVTFPEIGKAIFTV